MSNVYASVGRAVGLSDIGERFHRRRLEDEDRKLKKEDRELALSDRDRRISREDEMLARDRERYDREKQQWVNQDEDREHLGEKREWEREDRKRTLTLRDRDDAEFAKDSKHKDYTRDRQRKLDGRVDYEWSRSVDLAQRKMREEGMDRMISSLKRGADPRMIEREFNAKGELGIKPGTLQYDSQTGNVRFSDSDGEEFDGPIEQLEAMYSMPSAPIKLGANDRMVDPKTGQEVIPPSGGGGSNYTTANRLTASKRAADVVSDGLGARDNGFGQLLAPPGKEEKNAFGRALANQVVDFFGEKISPDEAGYIALDVAQSVMSQGEAEQEARDRLGVKGRDVTPEIRELAGKIIRADRTRAAQRLRAAIAEKESEVAQRRRYGQPGQAASPGAGGAVFSSEYEVGAALERGELQFGDIVTVNGKKFRIQ